MTVTIKDVAKKAGVSTATVSHVINETRFVAEETKAKVIQAMEELDYHPNYAARSLRSKTSSNIGLIVPNFDNYTYTNITGILEDMLRKKGYNIIFSNSRKGFNNKKERIEVFKGQLVEGLIIIPSEKDNSYIIKVLEKVNYPIVFLEKKIKGFERDAVLFENYNASYKAVDYLVNNGFQKIGLIKSKSSSHIIEERCQGYKRALADNNIKYKPSLIKSGELGSDESYYLTKELIKENNVSAIYVLNSEMMLNVFRYIKEKDIKVPQELGLLCFGDLNWSTVIKPSLSVIKLPIKKMTSLAVEILMERINSKEFEKREIRLPCQLEIRDSC